MRRVRNGSTAGVGRPLWNRRHLDPEAAFARIGSREIRHARYRPKELIRKGAICPAASRPLLTFTSPRFAMAAKQRRFEPRLGRVGVRKGRSMAACLIMGTSRSMASLRLASCVRKFEAVRRAAAMRFRHRRTAFPARTMWTGRCLRSRRAQSLSKFAQ